MAADRRYWVKARRTCSGLNGPAKVSVTVTIVEGSHSVSWSAPCYSTTIRDGYVDALKGAEAALAALQLAPGR